MPGKPGRSGRKPKPTKQKALANNPGKRKLNKDEPEYGELTNVDPPEWLDDLAAEVWKFYAPKLCEQRILTVIDLHNLEAFCAAYSRWRLAERELAEGGLVVDGPQGPKKNPAATVLNEALRQMQTFGASLGLSPSDRGRIKVPDGPKKNPFKDL